MEMFLVAGMNSTPSNVRKIAALAEQIRPDRIHLNTAVRPPAEAFATPLSEERMGSLLGLFGSAAEVVADFGYKQDVRMHGNQEEILSMLQRRPCTAEEVAQVYGMHLNEVSKYLGALMRSSQIHAELKRGTAYYRAQNIGKDSQ
jgi:wyosine [tRNA(Phe)-imidazoG37] synthetase (radical SAM superfamily)